MVLATGLSTAQRVIAVGASNLTRLLPALVRLASSQCPTEHLVAAGHGRSFCGWSRVLGRALPGIDACGIWDALDVRPVAPRTIAVLMDVGNDLLYGVAVERIIERVDAVLARLAARAERLVVVGLPGDGRQRIGRGRYAFLRFVLVPGAPRSQADVLRDAGRLQAALAERAHQLGADFISLQPAWYGFDPIHLRRRHGTALIARCLGIDEVPERLPGPSSCCVRSARPAERLLFGWVQRQAQPARRFVDGSTLSLY